MQLSNTVKASKNLTSRLLTIPQGDAGVKVTLSHMVKHVKEYKKSLLVRQTVLSITSNVLQKDWRQEIKSIFDFVKFEIRYIRDIRGVETVQTPDVTLQLKQGDCDDKTQLICAMLESIGYKTRMVAAAFNQSPNYSHVFAQVKLGDKWITLETTEPQPIGWTPPNITKQMIVYN